MGESSPGVGAGNLPLDASGNGHDFTRAAGSGASTVGTLQPAPSNNHSTAYYDFQGIGYYQNQSDPEALRAPDDNFGMELWVRHAVYVGGRTVLLSTGDVAVGNGMALLYGAPGGPDFAFTAQLQGLGGFVGNPYLMQDTNEWLHLALVRDSGISTFYVNGLAYGPSLMLAPLEGSELYMAMAYGGGKGFIGDIDEARLFTFDPASFDPEVDLLITTPATAPAITLQPANVAARLGSNVVLTVACSGHRPLAYQWFFGLEPLPGQTNAALAINLAAGQIGAYRVVVTNSLGATTSLVGTINVIRAVQPSQQQQAMMSSKYGMFCHFNIDTFLNTELGTGMEPATTYAPTGINADQWVSTAYLAGMRYFILVTKHHEGFCLWNSAYTDYDVAYSGNTNDVVRLVADACAKYGVKLAIYYSVWDLHEPSYQTNFYPGYIQFMENQITELLTQYGPVCEIWLDGGWEKPYDQWHMAEIYQLVKQLQPDCQVSLNWPIGDPYQIDTQVPLDQQQEGDPIRYFPCDFRMGDPYLPIFPDPKLFMNGSNTYYLPFETTTTLSARDDWFYHTDDPDAKPLGQLEYVFNRATAQDNRLVLNAPPDRNGNLLPSNTNALLGLAARLGLEPGQPFPVNLASGKMVTASSTMNDDAASYGPENAVDEDPDSRWAAGAADASCSWLEIDFGQPTTFNRVIINEYGTNSFHAVQQFAVSAWDGTNWQVVSAGTTIGESKRLDSSSVTSSRLRLDVLMSAAPASISMLKVQQSPALPPSLTILNAPNGLTLNWPYGTLQAGSAPTGPFTNVFEASSPWSLSPHLAQQYFRVKLE